jgi:hypothetical protein
MIVNQMAISVRMANGSVIPMNGALRIGSANIQLFLIILQYRS